MTNHSEESNDVHKAKKDRFLGSMFVDQIQSLIANAIKAQLGGQPHKTC